MLFVLRLAARVDSYITFLLEHSAQDLESIFSTLRDVDVPQDITALLAVQRDDLMRLIRRKVCMACLGVL